MDIVGKRAEPSDLRRSFSAATFRKVLKGFEIGGLPYTEVQFQLKRLLATGVSPGELREVLRRSELIEPLPEYAYREVLGLLDDAIAQDAALQVDPDGAIDKEAELDPAALAADLQDVRSALESEQTRARDAEEALSARIAAEEAVRSRLDTSLRESERYQADLRAARNSVASRDKVTAQMRQTLDERDAELATLRREHAELAAARAEIERSLTDSNSLSGKAREKLSAQEKSLAETQQSLAQRDAQLAALKRAHAETLASSESCAHGAAQLQADLQAARAQAASLAAELGAAQGAFHSERRELSAAHGNALADMRQTLAERDALLAALRQGHAKAISESQEKLHAAQWQAAAHKRASEAAAALPRVERLSRARAQDLPSLLSRCVSGVRGWRWNSHAAPRAAWIGAATVLLATAIWLAVHASLLPSSPLVSAAALIQPVTTVLPTGQFDQESAAAENGSVIEKAPHAAASAAGKAATTGAKPNSDLQRCRAGGIDACYDAIRWRPSDPLLLSALGDALLRANRPADALRTYQRLATLAPNTPGVAAKISASDAKLSAKRTPKRAAARTAAADAGPGNRYRNSAAASQSR